MYWKTIMLSLLTTLRSLVWLWTWLDHSPRSPNQRLNLKYVKVSLCIVYHITLSKRLECIKWVLTISLDLFDFPSSYFVAPSSRISFMYVMSIIVKNVDGIIVVLVIMASMVFGSIVQFYWLLVDIKSCPHRHTVTHISLTYQFTCHFFLQPVLVWQRPEPC